VRHRGHNHGERNDDPELAYASLSQLARQVGADQLRLQPAGRDNAWALMASGT
jgi:hypothetical protein